MNIHHVPKRAAHNPHVRTAETPGTGISWQLYLRSRRLTRFCRFADRFQITLVTAFRSYRRSAPCTQPLVGYTVVIPWIATTGAFYHHFKPAPFLTFLHTFISPILYNIMLPACLYILSGSITAYRRIVPGALRFSLPSNTEKCQTTGMINTRRHERSAHWSPASRTAINARVVIK